MNSSFTISYHGTEVNAFKVTSLLLIFQVNFFPQCVNLGEYVETEDYCFERSQITDEKQHCNSCHNYLLLLLLNNKLGVFHYKR